MGEESFDFVIDFQLHVLSGSQNRPSGEGIKVFFFDHGVGFGKGILPFFS